ncbi:MAG TPA: TolC family protein [Bacteroidales bacterium]|nr:TolC family protein [Bacteroidales bacterium]
MKRLISILVAVVAWGLLLNLPAVAQQDSIWTLDMCIKRAYDQNIQIRKSEVTNQQSAVYADQARARRMPSLNGSINENFNWSKSNSASASGFSGVNGSNYSLNSGVVLFNSSRITNEIKQADLQLESGKYSLETTKESISLNILDAYLQVLYSEEQVKNTQRQIETITSQLNLAKERLDLQGISTSDYAKVKSQLASEKLTLANSESQLSIAKINLMQLIELPVRSDFEVAHPDLGKVLNKELVPDVHKVYEAALAIKPQIKNATVNKEIAGLDEKIAKASYFPVLSASAGVSSAFSSRTTDPYFNQLNNGISPSVGFSLAIPIYQKKQVKTSVEVARLGYQNAELSEVDTRNQLRKSIEQACLDVTSAQVEYEANLENYKATLDASTLSDEQFNQGMINSTDYLVAKTNLIVAESQLLQSKYNLIFSYKVLDFYMGTPLTL